MRRPAIILLFCLLALAACKKTSDRSPVIATVNGDEVGRAEFERFMAAKLGELSNSETSDVLRSQMLDEYLRRLLVLRDAERAGLTVAEVEIEQAAQENPQLRARAAGDDSREEMRRDLLVEKYYRQVVLGDMRVTTDEAQRYIEQNQARLTDKPGFLVREIRVQRREEADRFRGPGAAAFGRAERGSRRPQPLRRGAVAGGARTGHSTAAARRRLWGRRIGLRLSPLQA